MKFYVGVTENEWFRFLAEHQPDEVNFWRPGGGSFRAIRPGAPFLFKLHSPLNYITGGGFFVSYSVLPLSLAWETFREKNGAAEFATFYQQIRRYREGRGAMRPDPEIGCVVLVQPFFFAEGEWIPVPDDWHPSIVQGKTYDMQEPNDLRVEVSRRIKDDFENGEHYYAMQGRALSVTPRRSIDRPSPEFVRWHQENRFLG